MKIKVYIFTRKGKWDQDIVFIFQKVDNSCIYNVFVKIE